MFLWVSQSLFVPDRFICFSPKFWDKELCLLVPGPRCLGGWCLLITLEDFKLYVCPSFSLLGRVPRKLKLEEVSDALIIAPCLPTAHWYPQLPELLVQRPALLPQCETPTLASGRRSTSSQGNDTTNCVACNRDSQEVRGISQRAANYVLKPWWPGTVLYSMEGLSVARVRRNREIRFRQI